MNKTQRLMALTVILFFSAVSVAYNSDLQMQTDLESAFLKAFSEPTEFKGSEIFQLLGYDAGEIAQIGRITPRPASITVQVEPGNGPGYFKNIKVVCYSVHYYNLTIERVTFDFPDCQINVGELKNGNLRFLAGDSIKLKTEVSQNDILKVFDFFAKARDLSGLRLKLDADKANLRGKVKKGFVVVEFNLNGITQLVDAKTVMFRCSRLVLNGSPMPRNTLNAIFAQINPVFDASKTWLNLNIASINIKRGFVETIATIDKKKG